MIINFTSDFEDYMRHQLSVNGFKHIPFDRDLLFIHYCNIVLRRIGKLKRKIQKSIVFECPKNLTNGLRQLETAISKGEDLLPWQSKNILNTGYDDHMCFNWGIYHLHLGETREKDSQFMVRTGLVLYCLVDFQNIYFIQILEHGEKHSDELLVIARSNWPKLFPKNISNNSAEEKMLSAGKKADHLKFLLTNFEDYVRENAEKFARQIKRISGNEISDLQVKLEIDENTSIAYAEEIHSGVRFKLGTLPLFHT